MTLADFSALMDVLPGARSAPHLAVAVSGGADSMALALLAKAWCGSHRRSLTALTVDHGLRPESGYEAQEVAAWCRTLGIAHEILTWRGEKPRANVQALARQARYRLLDEWCLVHKAPVLLLAHHLEDQAETVLLRLGRGSGVYGLAGMSAEVPPAYPGAPMRARPLLGVPKSRLAATLQERRQDWIEDPSNLDPRFARVRARALWDDLAGIGITPARLSKTAAQMARAKEALDGSARTLIAKAGGLTEAGYASLALAPLRSAYDEIGLRALARVLMAIGGGIYPPRLERLERLWACIRDDRLGGGVTLGGCRIVPAADGATLHIVREARSMEGPLALQPGRQVWDGRFLVEAARDGSRRIDRLGRSGMAEIRAVCPNDMLRPVPAVARPVLPALFDRDGLAAVPALNYRRKGLPPLEIRLEFLPRHGFGALAKNPQLGLSAVPDRLS